MHRYNGPFGISSVTNNILNCRLLENKLVCVSSEKSETSKLQKKSQNRNSTCFLLFIWPPITKLNKRYFPSDLPFICQDEWNNRTIRWHTDPLITKSTKSNFPIFPCNPANHLPVGMQKKKLTVAQVKRALDGQCANSSVVWPLAHSQWTACKTLCTCTQWTRWCCSLQIIRLYTTVCHTAYARRKCRKVIKISWSLPLNVSKFHGSLHIILQDMFVNVLERTDSPLDGSSDKCGQ